MDIIRINDEVSVSPQISVDDVAAIKAAGFVAVVNNRPDGEEPGQPAAQDIKAACEAAGLTYVDIPMGRAGVTPDLISNTRAVLDGAEGPVFCFCRSGTRSTTLWALSQAGRAPADEIIDAAARAGYNISHLAAHLG